MPFEKAKYRVTNWGEYNESLRRRGDLRIWFGGDALHHRTAPRRKSRGGQRTYSDLAIEICLTLRSVFRLALRQSQGMVRSIAKLMGFALKVPDFSTLSRRSKGLKTAHQRRRLDTPITLIVDSTGLKVHSDTDWHAKKHSLKKPCKTWRKLHVALDANSGDIVAAELTTEHVADETALPELIENVDADVARFLADGADDGQGVSDCLVSRFGPDIEIVIPPPKNAIHGNNPRRNQHVEDIATLGRMKWQEDSGYDQRSIVEAQIGRWKQVIGTALRARNFDAQTCEINIAAKALNRMNDLGRAQFERVS